MATRWMVDTRLQSCIIERATLGYSQASVETNGMDQRTWVASSGGDKALREVTHYCRDKTITADAQPASKRQEPWNSGRQLRVAKFNERHLRSKATSLSFWGQARAQARRNACACLPPPGATPFLRTKSHQLRFSAFAAQTKTKTQRQVELTAYS